MKLKVSPLSLAALLLSLSALFVSVYALKGKQVVTFDEKGTIQTFVRQLSLKQVPLAKAKSLSQKFKLSLKQTLAEYSSSNSVIILKPQEVVMGAQDITPIIQACISMKMAEQSK
jgi:type-F conjugative transfer system protein TrbI